MKLIVGGSYAGKTEYVKGRFGLREEEILDLSKMSGSMQSESELMRQITGKKCLLHLEEWVRALLTAEKEPLAEAEKLLRLCPDGIFVMNEIGNGIVPMEREERIWREAVGRTGCFLAERAEEVVRVVCGLPARIK